MEAIGSTTKPIYIGTDGAAKPIAGPIGGSRRPIYINDAGEITQGDAPLYSFSVPHANASTAGILKTVLSAGFVGTDANGDLKAVTLPEANASTKGILKTVLSATIAGTDSNGQIIKKKLSKSTGSVSTGSGSVSPTKETWTFEAVDGSTTTKDVVSNVTGSFLTSASGTFVTNVSVEADA